MNINLVLYQPEIPQNTGNIMRTCAATDVTLHLIKPLGFSLDEKAIRRSGSNYVDKTDYHVYENWEDFISKNVGEYFFLTRYGQKAPSEFNYKECNKDIYFILGSESSGMPKDILKDHLDTCFRLPMNENVRSLNVSNVAAIIVYEALRQFDYQDLKREEPEIFKGKDFLTK